jgi:hypothetical protein
MGSRCGDGAGAGSGVGTAGRIDDAGRAVCVGVGAGGATGREEWAAEVRGT